MEHDIIILGGGPAGSVAGMQLKQEGYSVLLLEASNFESHRVGETLPPAFAETFGSLGISTDLGALGHQDTHAFGSAWGTNDLEFSSYMDSPYGKGWHVNRAKFDHMLFNAACQKEVNGIQGCRILATNLKSNQTWEVQWKDDLGTHTSTGKFLLNACGRKNVYHKRMKDVRVDYDDLAAAVWLIKGHVYQQEAAMIESAAHGWWYSSPLPGGSSIVMFMSDLDIISSHKLTDFDCWYEMVKKSANTFNRLPKPENPKPIFIKPANSQRVSRVQAPNYLPIGDALVSFDPLNGAGVIRAIETAQGGARVVKRHLEGDSQAIPMLLESVKELYDTYLIERAEFYKMEERWLTSEFWKRRN